MTAVEMLQAGAPHRALPLLAKKAKKEPTIDNLLVLSAAQRGCCQFERAMDTLHECLVLTQGKSAEVWNNIAQVYSDQGKFQEVPAIFQRALRVAESTPTTHGSMQQILLGFAYSLMRLGQFEYSWEAFEAGRFAASWGTLPMTKLWRGEPNSRVLIVPEGGFGDAFLFSRWIPKVREMSDRVGILMWDKLLDFCDWKRFGVNEIIPLKKSVRASDWDYSISIMSLPGIFKMKSWTDIPPDGMRDAFIETLPSHERVPRIHHDPPRIGYCWRAEENGSVRKIRSLDDHTAGVVAKELAKYGPVYGLCPQNKGLHKFDKFRVPQRVIQEEEKLATWHETASYILSMDLVVAVDTAGFHLAALLGVPTLLLLPCRSDWKYSVRDFGPDVKSQFMPQTQILGTPRDRDRWYGPHVTYYRETKTEGWTASAIIDAIAAAMIIDYSKPAPNVQVVANK